ncbi:MAG: T9SS type A sorting domain-containing protein [Flavobacteriales bacterium]|nr:T9SS type A sorting domain-containing protein [Flavobacteriales bacterium]
MLKPTTALIFLTGLAAAGQAQTVALFTVDQPPQFQVDAGDDLVYEPGLTLQMVATGGTSTYTYLWSPSQFLDDPTAAAPQVQGLFSTTLFTVQVTDPGLDCTLTDEVLVDFATGMFGTGDGVLDVFPNPTDGPVRIHATGAILRVQLRAPNGALVTELSGMAMRDVVMDVSALPAGVYFMTVSFTAGRSHTYKLCTTSAH